jgi:membrane protein YqaA with SNARE-associated domain
MDLGDPSTAVLALASVVALFVASGVLPFVNAELSLLALGSVAPRPLLLVLLVVATLSHMAGKSLTYFAGRSAEHLPIAALQRRVATTRGKLDGRTNLGATLIFVSATTGFPPFYLVTVASGVLRYNFLHYFVLGFGGRLLRFGALLLLPQLAGVLGPQLAGVLGPMP